MYFMKKKNIVFISLILILNIFLLFLFKYKNSQVYIQELSNELYTTNSKEFIIPNLEKSLQHIENEKKYRLFIEFGDIRFLKSNDEEWSPPILEGKFFPVETNKTQAVVGKNLINIIKEVDGKNVISFDNKYYEVIGIMGEEFTSRIDSLILLTSDKIPSVENQNIVIDSSNKCTIKKISNAILSQENCELIEKEYLGLNRLVKSDFFSGFFSIYSILVVIFSILVYGRYWFEKEKRFLELLNMLGFRKSKIKSIYLKNVILNLILANILTVIIGNLLIKNIAIDWLIKSVLITNITTISVSIVYIHLGKKK